ncbi:MAG: bifunctional phosphopantothenoylcysteine decarboxylase/phosphopantothenate--cysteine ligase CoaBC [Nitrosomonadaceae bacterium]|nr:bifunctional phosphopantothenoylcysteine decarboxylase/phosphopantothenate--cysteine ligase CoaBC [Nitrosomonadaceae bacterium]|tara:strand:- start:4784 stop:5989 length:1206 start_codon:yes stop_codon:yes gene_type:complete
MPKLPLLSTKHIILGITGGIAAYKAAEVTRILVKKDLDVQVIMTASACKFIGPTTLQALTGKTVLTDLWDSRINNNMTHINSSRDASAILVAPASANFIAKLANGFADDLLSALCLARNCPLFIAPAMNCQMWENSATQRNLSTLQRDGVIILGPDNGSQACGEIGMGRMTEAQNLVKEMLAYLQPKLLQNKHILITAGPTYEAIDAVRGITNLSSGKMGYAVANAALEAGAKVTLVSGPTSIKPPYKVSLINVVSAQEMFTAVKNHASSADIFISVAAVADFFLTNNSKQKIKRTNSNISLTFSPNPDILGFVAKLTKPPFCVGFAAETENLEENAETKRNKKKIPLLVANLVPNTINSDECELVLFDDEGKHLLPKALKVEQARHIIKHVSLLYKKWKK